MVDEAQNILEELLKIQTVDEFNSALLHLFTVIPRKMSTVSEYLAKSPDDFTRIIAAEQDLLDVMKGQVIQKTVEEERENSSVSAAQGQTILEALGLEFEQCDESDIRKIKSCLGSCADQFHAAWRVRNRKTQDRFDQYVEDNHITNRKLLWHGSRNENWWSIINTGLVLRPTNAVITGKMFGYGIYYAPKARKSLGYTSLHNSYWARGNSSYAFMALLDVAYGKPFDVYSFDSKYYSFNYDVLQRACIWWS